MTFLQRSISHCCGYISSNAIGDAFKRFVPAAWSAICLVAWEHLIVPLSRGDFPRWGSPALAAASGTSRIRLTRSTYGVHRWTSSSAAEEGRDGDGDALIRWTEPWWRRRRVVLSVSSLLSEDARAADPRDSVRADAIPRPPSSVPSESIKTEPSATALPDKPSFESADDVASASDSLLEQLRQFGSVNREEMRLGVRSGRVRPSMRRAAGCRQLQQRSLPKSGGFRRRNGGSAAVGDPQLDFRNWPQPAPVILAF